jgi:hypothetical protein
MVVFSIFYVFDKKAMIFMGENMKLLKMVFEYLVFAYFSLKSTVCGKKL